MSIHRPEEDFSGQPVDLYLASNLWPRAKGDDAGLEVCRAPHVAEHILPLLAWVKQRHVNALAGSKPLLDWIEHNLWITNAEETELLATLRSDESTLDMALVVSGHLRQVEVILDSLLSPERESLFALDAGNNQLVARGAKKPLQRMAQAIPEKPLVDVGVCIAYFRTNIALRLQAIEAYLAQRRAQSANWGEPQQQFEVRQFGLLKEPEQLVPWTQDFSRRAGLVWNGAYPHIMSYMREGVNDRQTTWHRADGHQFAIAA